MTATNRLPLPAAASWRLGFQLGKELSEEGWKTILVSAPEKDLLLSHADQRCVTPPSLLSPSWIIPPRPSQSEIGRSGSQRAEWAPTYLPTQQSTTKSCLVQGIPLCCYRTKKPAFESWSRGSSSAKQIYPFSLIDFQVQILSQRIKFCFDRKKFPIISITQ